MAALVLAVVLAVVVGGTPPARAQDADGLGLQAELGVGGHVVVGAWHPVTVTLQPDAPLRGRILVQSTDGTSLLQSRPVEVGAGATARHHLLVPPGQRVRVQVVPDDEPDRAVTVTPPSPPPTEVLLGVLGQSSDGVPRVTLPTTGQRVVVTTIDDRLLDLGERALDSVGTVVTSRADLAALPDDHRRALVGHVTAGATLVVTDATEPDLGLPWRTITGAGADGYVPAPGAWAAASSALVAPTDGDAPADVAAVAAGRGRLVTTSWTLGSPGPATEPAVWEHLAQPTTTAELGSGPRPWTDLRVTAEQAFGSTAGEPPSMGWLAAFLLVYVLVAGPLLGVVLARRRRPELAWVVVPVVTALFAGVAFIGASATRPRVGVAARAATWVDGVGAVGVAAGVRSPQAGQHDLVLPGDGWSVTNAGWEGVAHVTPGDDTVVSMSLPSQALGAVVAWRPVTAPSPLDVEVALLADRARVEVTNTTDQDLERLRLRVATHEVELAEVLAAGETLVDTVPLAADLPPGDRVDLGIGGPFDRDPGPEAAGALLRWEVLDGTPGTTVVTATTTAPLDLPTPTVDGSAPVDRGALLVVATTPPVTDDATTPWEVQRDLVAVGGDLTHEAPQVISGVGPATLRFRLPSEGPVEGLELQVAPGGLVREAPDVVPLDTTRCGQLEMRDEQTGAMLSVTDMCTDGPPCPPDATSCSWGADGKEMVGQACFVQGPCRDLRWVRDDAVDVVEPLPVQAGGLQVFDHVERRWVDLPGGRPTVRGADLDRWLGPLGEVWVRVLGPLGTLDLGPQGVAATLEGRG